MAANNSNDNLELGIIIIGGALFIVIWFFFPQLFGVPMYAIRYAQSFIMSYIPFFEWDQQGQIMLKYLDQVNPFDKNYRDWIISMYESKVFYIWTIAGGILCVIAALRFSKRNNLIMVKGAGVDLEEMIAGLAEVDHPHLLPFVNFNPLNMDEKHGIWRMPDTMLSLLVNEDIMPFCKGCKLPLYTWEDGSVNCESNRDRRNLLQGNSGRFCRVKKDPETTVYYFHHEKARQIFYGQVTKMGLMPATTKELPAILHKIHPFTYLIVAMCIARMEEEGYQTQVNLNLAVKLMAKSVRGFKENGEGVADKEALNIAINNAKQYMRPEIIEKYAEPLDRHGYVVTYIMGLLDYVHLEKGGLPTSLFSYLIGFRRDVYYALNVIGSPSPHIEAWGCFYHYKSEVELDEPIVGTDAVILSKRYTALFAKEVGDDTYIESDID